MTDKTPTKRRPDSDNNNTSNTARKLDFRTEEEIAADERAEQNWWDFITRCLESLKISLQYNLPITLEGSQAALFIRNQVDTNAFLQSPNHSDHTENESHDDTFSTNNHHTPSQQRFREILHKNPATLEVIRFRSLLPEPEQDDNTPEAGFTYTTADGRTFVGSPRLDATHEDSLEITPGVDDQTLARPERDRDETPGAPIAQHGLSDEASEPSTQKGALKNLMGLQQKVIAQQALQVPHLLLLL